MGTHSSANTSPVQCSLVPPTSIKLTENDHSRRARRDLLVQSEFVSKMSTMSFEIPCRIVYLYVICFVRKVQIQSDPYVFNI